MAIYIETPRINILKLDRIYLVRVSSTPRVHTLRGFKGDEGCKGKGVVEGEVVDL